MNDMHVIKTRETAIQKELDRIESEEEVKIDSSQGLSR